MEVDILRVIISILLIFFIPGFLLVQALFPMRNELDEEDDWLYRIALGIAFSIVITTLDGFILSSIGINPDTGKGYWDTPYIFGSLIGISLVLFLIGWFRGAYPILGRKTRVETPIKIPKKDKEQYYKIMERWKKLYKKLEKLNEQLRDGDFRNQKEHEGKITKITKEVKELEDQMVKLGHKEIPHIKARSPEMFNKK